MGKRAKLSALLGDELAHIPSAHDDNAGPRFGIVVAEFYVGPLTLLRQMKTPFSSCSWRARYVPAWMQRAALVAPREATIMRRPRNEQLRGLAFADTWPHGELCRGSGDTLRSKFAAVMSDAGTRSYAYLMTRFYGWRAVPKERRCP